MQTYLELLFGNRPPDTQICCSTIGDYVRTKFYADPRKLCRYALEVCEERDVYVGLCVQSLAPRRGRGSYKDMVAAGMYALDLDVAKDDTYPPTKEAAFALLEEAYPGMPPTVVVKSGATGYHVYWKFDRWYTFATDEERDVMQKHWKAFTRKVQAVAAKKGWRVDSTYDLTRILRLPGTYNLKTCPAVPVVLEEYHTDRVYSPDSFGLDWEHEPLVTGKFAVRNVVVPLTVPDVPDTLDVLMTNNERVKQAALGTRQDLADTSLSGQDMSLAALLVREGWEPQDIVTALVACVRLRKGAKIKDPGYYLRTVENAMPEGEEEMVDVQTREGARGFLLEKLGIDIQRMEQMTTDEPFYIIYRVDAAPFVLPTSTMLYTRTAFEKRLMEVLRRVVRVSKKGTEWDNVRQALLTLCTLVSDEEVEKQMGGWLNMHWVDCGQPDTANLSGSETLGSVIEDGKPFIEGGYLWVCVPSLHKYVLRESGQMGLTTQNVMSQLRVLGFEKKDRAYTVDNKPRSKVYWFGQIPS